jgi:hypothetical protein
MRKTILVSLLLLGSALAQTTVTNDNAGTTKVTTPEGQITTSCGTVNNVYRCESVDTSVEAAMEHGQSRRQYFKSIKAYCDTHKPMKWKDCKKAVGPYMDPSL